ncbi:hypothetical protein [Micromonospora sp. LOL_024]|uniref:hypothetical protein n=1 Tax=Micromonospora sp. LOL_024 TaxID=3345412 RepID=UPI003A896C07
MPGDTRPATSVPAASIFLAATAGVAAAVLVGWYVAVVFCGAFWITTLLTEVADRVVRGQRLRLHSEPS